MIQYFNLIFYPSDNNRILNYSSDTHGKASNKCQSEGSFIKWYSDDYCKSSFSSVPLWTSGRRHIHSYHLRKSGKCFINQKYNITKFEML